MVSESPIQRMAWIGSPSLVGVGGMCRLFLQELAKSGISVDVYSQNDPNELPKLLGPETNTMRFFTFDHAWNWNSWYGRNAKLAFVMSFVKRLRSYRELVNCLIAEHRRKPYDVVVQFSQGELFALGKHAGEIPIVLYPCVHAAGERYWCRKEEDIARRCEPWWWRKVRDLYLSYRSSLQKRDYRRARGVIGMSQRFNRWIEKDYGVSPEKMGFVYHPIKVPPPPVAPSNEEGELRIRLLFVGRISVRKGLEQLLEILPELLNDHPDIKVAVIGGGSLWSNYEPLLEDFPITRCTWIKALPNDKVIEEMQRSDILLVPSRYEPGGIVVGEALACGMIVVASDEVGSAENLPSSVCKQFRSGDRNGFKTAIQAALADVRSHGSELREEARSVAKEQFDPAKMTHLLLSELEHILEGETVRR